MEFVQFEGFDRLRNIENILLVFDESCEEIYNDKEFVKLATTGRDKGLMLFMTNIIYSNKVDGHELWI